MQIIATLLILSGTVASSLTSKNEPSKDFTLVLDPAGDTQNSGRVIGNQFERGLTLQCAEYIKNQLHKEFPTIRITLTRFPGETAPVAYKNASFANKIGANLYISLHLYQQHDTRTLGIYTFGRGDTPPSRTHKKQLSFTPVHKVHQKSSPVSQQYAQLLYEELVPLFEKGGLVYAPTAVPLKALEGLDCPAFCIELSTTHKHDALRLMDSLCQALIPVINQALQEQL